jgi:protein-S-isoprenylcysteine O-methyltransferase Ste14
MNAARYVIAVMMLVAVPFALCLWYLIHPFARFWRRLGPLVTYVILSVPIAAGCAGIWAARERLLGRDLGTSAPLIVLAVVSATVGAAIAWQRRKHLTQRVLAGIPELSRDPGRLLTGGIYSQTRNPRYLEFLFFSLAYIAFANYAGAWVLYACMFPATHLVVLLEERELRERFGAEYEAYCRRVPRYVPRRFWRTGP